MGFNRSFLKTASILGMGFEIATLATGGIALPLGIFVISVNALGYFLNDWAGSIKTDARLEILEEQ